MQLRPHALLAVLVLATAGAFPIARPPAAAQLPRRVVSLMPSLTEDLFAVGAGDAVVGVSAYSDFPPRAKRLPTVATAGGIATERIVSLHADLAVGIPAQTAAAADLRRAGIRTVLIPDDSYDDLFADLRTLGALTGHRAQALALVAGLQRRTAALTATVPRRARRPTVLVLLGTAPVYTAGRGSYLTRLIALAGGENAANDVAAPYAMYSAEAVVRKQPDVLLVDRDVERSGALARAPWSELRAVRARQAYVVPDGAPLYRPGPRYNEGLAWLIARLRAVRAS